MSKGFKIIIIIIVVGLGLYFTWGYYINNYQLAPEDLISTPERQEAFERGRSAAVNYGVSRALKDAPSYANHYLEQHGNYGTPTISCTDKDSIFAEYEGSSEEQLGRIFLHRQIVQAEQSARAKATCISTGNAWAVSVPVGEGKHMCVSNAVTEPTVIDDSITTASCN